MTESSAASRVLVHTEGALGRLTLNRPEAINALDPGMIQQLTEALERWRDDTDVQIVVIDGAGDRGCARGETFAHCMGRSWPDALRRPPSSSAPSTR